MNGPVHKPLQTTKIGHKTTIERAVKKPPAYNRNSGLKRPAGGYLTKEHHQLESSGCAKPPAFAERPALGNATNGVRISLPPTVEPFMKASRFSATRSDPRLKPSAIVDAVPAESNQGPSYYTQRKQIACTPTPADDPLLSLSHPAYGLPPRLVENFSTLGVASIYPWQSACLLGANLLRGEGNLCYVAPTGGGKSLVSDVLMLKKIVENPDKKGILVLPYVALVQEKLRWLRRVVEGVQKVKDTTTEQPQQIMWRNSAQEGTIRVAGLVGGSKTKFSWLEVDICICTIEKANALVNAAIEDGTVGTIGIVIMDELHMIDDDSRGYVLELMATKLLALEQDCQIVGMSATLPNAGVLAQWLGGNFYISRYSPVPIEEFLVFDGKIYPAATANQFYKTAAQLNEEQDQDPTQALSQKPRPVPHRLIQSSPHPELKSPLVNAVVALAVETATKGYGALVFCSSRKGCELDATIIAQAMPGVEEIPPDVMERRSDLLSELRSCATGLDSILEKTVPFGVGFHHAGLTTEERDIVARAYDEGILKVIVATCSLSAGINLPARRVILHGARMGRDLVAPSMLRQMRGRAGRKGKDEIGETFLCCQQSDLEEVAELIEADLPNVSSCLAPEKRGIERALLEIIATKLATSNQEILDYVKKTLLYHLEGAEGMAQLVKDTLAKLIEVGLITEEDMGEHVPTLLGKAIVASSLTPEDGIFVHSQLKRAIQAFALDGDMHVLYTFTPISSCSFDINWKSFRREIETLDEPSLRVLSLVGIKPSVINKLAFGGQLPERTPEEVELARVYRLFYTALQLRDLCNEVPVHAIARKYDIPRGAVQTLAQTCHGFAAGMVKFCERMGWGALAAALDHMSDRLRAGARSDLLALAQVTFIKSRTARIFWDNGFKTVGAIANAQVKDIVPVLLMAQPKKLRLGDEDDRKYQEKLRLKAEVICKSAGRVWDQMMQAEMDESLEGLE